MGGRSGWKISGYVAEVLLGSGATGQVWRGRSVRSGQPVALKRINAGEPTRRRSAQAEAALLSALEHPHLVRLHELVPDGDDLVLVLDLADGGSLADILGRRHRLEPGEVITALSPIAAALAYAHDEGVTHGDVSAANVLFTADGLPLLADLGTARLLGDTSLAQATLSYLDPAVAAGGAPAPPSDVFALAAVALHALSGSPPWRGESASEIIAQAASGEIPDLELRLGAVAPTVAAVVRRGLALEPYARGSAAEFALDLRQAAQPLPVELLAGRGGRRPAPSDADLGEASASVGRHQQSIVLPSSPAASTPPTGSRQWRGSFDRPGFTRPRNASVRTGEPTNADPGPAGSPGPVGFSDEADAEGSPERTALPITHAVRARARPPLPVAGRGVRWLGPIRLRVAGANRRRAAGAVMIVAALVVGVVAWRALEPARTSAPRASSGSPTTAAGSAMAAGTQWAKVLSDLDAQRERAFATSDPTLLAGVYAPGSLLDQDAASMARSVPAGCRAVGLRTTYAGVVVLAHTDTLATIRATATLASASITCGTVVSTHTSARPATELTIELLTTGSGYRIAGLKLE